MEATEYLKESIGVILLKQKSIESLAKRKDATVNGFIVLLIAGVVLSLPRMDIAVTLASAVSLPIGFFIFYSLFHFMAHRLGGTGIGSHYFRALASSFIIYIPLAVPIIASFAQDFAAIWLMVVNAYVIQDVHKLPLWKAAVAVLLGFLASFLMLSLFFMGTGFEMI